MLTSRKNLGDILIARGLIKQEQLQAALLEQKRTKEYVGAILVRRGLVREKDLLSGIAEQFGIVFVSLTNSYLDWHLIKSFSSSLVLEHRCMPLAKDEDCLTMAIVDPLDVWALQKCEEEAWGVKVRFVLASKDDMDDALLRYRQHLRSSL